MAAFVEAHPRLFVLTGAGISTASGIPDYRDNNGEWKHAKPIDFRDFISSHSMRQRYWARSSIGWARFSAAQPNVSHRAVAELERQGHLEITVTQNVDRLHQRAGSIQVVDLHGRNDQIVCMDCSQITARAELHTSLMADNPALNEITAEPAPDGDAHLEQFDFTSMSIPACDRCGGILKPAVVFFGENVPGEQVQRALDALNSSSALLVLGSSLMVYSGFRFVRRAHEAGLPIAAVNLGKTRADELFDLKIEARCDDVLSAFIQLPN